MDINAKIREVKTRIIELTKHFPYTEFEINMLTISYIAIASIDNDITDILDMTLAKCYVLFNDGRFNKLLHQYYEDYRLSFDIYQEPTFTNKEVSQNDFIVISSFPIRSTFDIIEALLHELKHALSSIVNSFMVQGDNASFYCGICEFTQNQVYYHYLEEAFNSFMTRLYLDQVSRLSELEIEDKGIKTILDKFKVTKPPFYEYLYERTTELFLPLFNDKDLFSLFYNASLYKDFAPLFSVLSKMFKGDLNYIFDELLGDYFNNNYGLILKYFINFNYSNIPELSLESHYNHI